MAARAGAKNPPMRAQSFITFGHLASHIIRVVQTKALLKAFWTNWKKIFGNTKGRLNRKEEHNAKNG